LLEELFEADPADLEQLLSELRLLHVLLVLLETHQLEFQMDEVFTKLAIEDTIFFLNLRFTENILNDDVQDLLV